MTCGMLALSLLAAPLGAAPGDGSYRSAPPRVDVTEDRDFGPWLAPYRAKLTPGLLRDFGERYIYAAADRALPPPRANERRVVFLGDSITDNWDLGRFFPGKLYINRGIGSQTTAQMLLRFEQDVVALRPSAVVILGGINDLQGLIQMETDENIEANWQAMADIAERNGIRPIFATLIPVNNYTPNARTMLQERKPERINMLNQWLAQFCATRRYAMIRYHDAMMDSGGLLQAGYTQDGLHPNEAAYRRMARIAEETIDAAIASPAPR